jgi:hypothetical protein
VRFCDVSGVKDFFDFFSCAFLELTPRRRVAPVNQS